MQGLFTPSPKYFLTDSYRLSKQSRNYSASGINQQANRKKSIQLWSWQNELEQPQLDPSQGCGMPTFPSLSLPGGANGDPLRPPNSRLHHMMQISSSRQEDLCVFTSIAHLSGNRSESTFCFKWNWKCPLNQQKVPRYAVKPTSGPKIKLRVTKTSITAIVHATVFTPLDI